MQPKNYFFLKSSLFYLYGLFELIDCTLVDVLFIQAHILPSLYHFQSRISLSIDHFFSLTPIPLSLLILIGCCNRGGMR